MEGETRLRVSVEEGKWYEVTAGYWRLEWKGDSRVLGAIEEAVAKGKASVETHSGRMVLVRCDSPGGDT